MDKADIAGLSVDKLFLQLTFKQVFTRCIMNKLIDRNGLDLTQVPVLNKLLLWNGFPYVFQFMLLLAFIALAVMGWNLYPPEGVHDRLFAQTNLVNLLVWGIWWPLMVLTAILFGRLWCMICPLELVSNVSERLSRKLGVKQRKLNRWIRSGAIVLALYALIQLLIAGIHLHRIPAYTSFFLIGLLILAALTGFLFSDRAFCRGFCPVGLLLNAYGRGSMLVVRPRSTDACGNCTGKDCVLACNRFKPDGRSCPSLLNPARLKDNSDCLLCGQCVKSCGPENMAFYLRRPFHPDDRRESLAAWMVTLFVMLISGYVTYRMTGGWTWAREIFLWTPQQLASHFSLEAYYGWIRGVWMLFVFPALIWTLMGGLVQIFTRESLGIIWRRLALPVVIFFAAAHLAEGISKLSNWAGYLPYALRAPDGIDVALMVTAGSMAVPEPLFSQAAVSVLAVLLLLVASFVSVREFRLANPGNTRIYLLPKLALSGMFLYIAFGWAAELIFGF